MRYADIKSAARSVCAACPRVAWAEKVPRSYIPCAAYILFCAQTTQLTIMLPTDKLHFSHTVENYSKPSIFYSYIHYLCSQTFCFTSIAFSFILNIIVNTFSFTVLWCIHLEQKKFRQLNYSKTIRDKKKNVMKR